MTHFKDNRIINVRLDQIDPDSGDNGLDSAPEALRQSIESAGILQPLVLVSEGKRYQVVCGVRRLQIARELALPEVPARILENPVSREEGLRLSLEDNRSHREYSGIEKAAFLSRLRQWGVNDDRIIDQYMPILNLQPAKKTLMDYLAADGLPDGLKEVLHELAIPMRALWLLTRWDPDSQAEAETMARILRPGVNKMREALEWIDEIGGRDGTAPAEVLRRDDVQKALQSEEPRYSNLREVLFALRHPNLDALRKEVWLALDELKLESGTRIRTDENFEKDDIRVELNFQTLDELLSQIEKLTLASRSQAMQRLIDTFQKMK